MQIKDFPKLLDGFLTILGSSQIVLIKKEENASHSELVYIHTKET